MMAAILILEPDARLGNIYAAGLRADEHCVTVCATAQAAVQAADTTRPDLVITEIQLTNHSGIEFLYEFRSYTDWRNIPVVVASQVPESAFHASRQLLRRRLGVAEYLYKPDLTLRQLRWTVAERLAA